MEEDIWALVPDEPKCEKVVGHPDWWFEDPATAGYVPRVSDYPIEKLSKTVGGIKHSLYLLPCDSLGQLLHIPFVRYLMGVPLPQLAREYREFIDFVQTQRITTYHGLWEEWYGAFTTLLAIEGEIPRFAWGIMRGSNFFTGSYLRISPIKEKLTRAGTGHGALEAVKAQLDGEESLAAEMMYDYVDKVWYDEHHEYPWYNAFDGVEGFLGYWCFEVAAINQIYGIDDTSLMGHRHYPTDLVRYYRDTVTNDHFVRSEQNRRIRKIS